MHVRALAGLGSELDSDKSSHGFALKKHVRPLLTVGSKKIGFKGTGYVGDEVGDSDFVKVQKLEKVDFAGVQGRIHIVTRLAGELEENVGNTLEAVESGVKVQRSVFVTETAE